MFCWAGSAAVQRFALVSFDPSCCGSGSVCTRTRLVTKTIWNLPGRSAGTSRACGLSRITIIRCSAKPAAASGSVRAASATLLRRTDGAGTCNLPVRRSVVGPATVESMTRGFSQVPLQERACCVTAAFCPRTEHARCGGRARCAGRTAASDKPGSASVALFLSTASKRGDER